MVVMLGVARTLTRRWGTPASRWRTTRTAPRLLTPGHSITPGSAPRRHQGPGGHAAAAARGRRCGRSSRRRGRRRLGALAAAAAGPPGGGWDKGTSGAMWAPVGTFLSTWLPRAHYVLMAANELAATLGPAVDRRGDGRAGRDAGRRAGHPPAEGGVRHRQSLSGRRSGRPRAVHGHEGESAPDSPEPRYRRRVRGYRRDNQYR